MSPSSKPLLVVGAGIAGVTSALEAAETGSEVILVEREPSVGGRVLRIHNYFPKLCPPSCGMEINVQRMERNPRIRVMTSTEVKKAENKDGAWAVTLETAPRYVKQSCTCCNACSEVCPATVKDPFNLEMKEVPAIRLPHADAWPRLYTLDRDACPDGCKKCVEACTYDAIDLDAKPVTETVEVSAVVMATGWKPYALEKMPEFGAGKLQDVVQNVQLERIAAPAGPTGGKILRPSTGEAPKSVAFVQCAGSRDVNHQVYCSGICCLASLKQITYVRDQLPDTEITMYYIDRRTPGRNEDVLTKVAALDKVKLVKGKVGKIELGDDGVLSLKVEDTEANEMLDAKAEMVVLATGMSPNIKGVPIDVPTDDDGFGLDDKANKLFVAGVARRPEDVASSVRDATGAAAKAIMAGRSA